MRKITRWAAILLAGMMTCTGSGFSTLTYAADASEKKSELATATEEKTNNTIKKVKELGLSKSAKEAAIYLLSADNNPGYSTQWSIISYGMAGYSAPSNYLSYFHNNILQKIKDKNGEFSSSMDYSKLILSTQSLAVMGGTGSTDGNFHGYNLLDGLRDVEEVAKEGISSEVWALLAVTSLEANAQKTDREVAAGNFLIEETSQEASIEDVTDATLVGYWHYRELADHYAIRVLSQAMPDGSYNSDNTEAVDVSLTAQAVLGLTAYREIYGKDLSTSEVTEDALNTGIAASVNALLSQADLALEFDDLDGNRNSESLAWVILAMIASNQRNFDFVKAYQALLAYQNDNGSFCYLYSKQGSNKASNTATYVALMAMSLWRSNKRGKPLVFDFTQTKKDRISIRVPDATSQVIEVAKKTTVTIQKMIPPIMIIMVALVLLIFFACLWLDYSEKKI